jgi:inositol transporter-like SP family MFS transporter
VPASWTLIAEIAPASRRGRLGGLAQVMWYSGPVVVLALSIALQPLGLLGARILFGQLIVVALITWWLRHGVGESQRWLEAQRLRAAGQSAGLPGGPSWSAGLRTLLRGPLLKPLFFLIGMYGIYNLAAGTSGFYMPYLYNEFGLHSQAADVGLECFKGALSIGAAALIFMPFVDKVNRRGMLAISIIGQAVAIGLFVVFKVSYPVAISYVLLGGICSGFGVQSSSGSGSASSVSTCRISPRRGSSHSRSSCSACTRRPASSASSSPLVTPRAARSRRSRAPSPQAAPRPGSESFPG